MSERVSYPGFPKAWPVAAGAVAAALAVYAFGRCHRDHVGSGIRETIIGGIELLAVCRLHADSLPEEVTEAMLDYGAIVAEHVEIRRD